MNSVKINLRQVLLFLVTVLATQVVLSEQLKPEKQTVVIKEKSINQSSKLNTAMALYVEGDFHEAFDQITDLFKAKPDDEQVNFALGMTAFGIGKLSHAALAFERVLVLNPNNDRARLELARTYASMGQFELSEEYFRQVLETFPPPQVQRNIQRYLDELKDAQSAWRAKIVTGTGFFYDDNVNIGPKSSVIRIQPTVFSFVELDRLTVDEQSQPQDDFGFFTSLTLQGIYDPGFRGKWTTVSGASYYRSWLEEHSDFTADFLRANTGLRHSGRTHLFDSRLKAEHLWRGRESLVSNFGLDSSFLYARTKRVLWKTDLDVESRDYAGNRDLDGLYYALGETSTVSLGSEGNSVSFGLSGFYTDAEAKEFEHYGLHLFGGVNIGLPGSVEWRSEVGLRHSEYRGRQLLATGDRDDDEVSFGSSLNKKLTKDWSASIGYQRTENKSTFDLYDFTRNVITISSDYSF